MLIEFNYEGPNETFTKNQTKPNIFFYYLKSLFFPWIYWNVAPRGIWFGRSFLFNPKFK